MHRHHQSGGLEVVTVSQKAFFSHSPASKDTDIGSSSTIILDGGPHTPPNYMYYPGGGQGYQYSRSNNTQLSPMRSAGAMGKATAVDELKALILAAEPGTGEVTRHIQEAQFNPRINAFTSLLQLVSRARQGKAKAVEIFEAMQTVAGISPNTFSYSALISALARVGDWETAERYFNELKERAKENPDLRPNTVTYAAMISAYEKARKLDAALRIFEEQLEDSVEPDVITYASLLSACERQGDVGKAVELLERMHAQGLAGPPQMYNSVIAACGMRWKPAFEAFLGMQCAGVEVSAQSATLLMASLCAGGQRDHALALLSQVEKVKWTLSLTAYSALLQLLSKMGDWRAADKVHAHMARLGIKPDPNAATAIIAAHSNGGDETGAEQLTAYFNSFEILNKSVLKAPISPGSRLQPESVVFQEAPLSDGGLSLPISESLDSESEK